VYPNNYSSTIVVYCSNVILDDAGYVVDGAGVVDGSSVVNATVAGTLNCDGAGSGIVDDTAGANENAMAVGI